MFFNSLSAICYNVRQSLGAAILPDPRTDSELVMEEKYPQVATKNAARIARVSATSEPSYDALSVLRTDLVQKVLDDGIGDLKTIKGMVKDWQGDYHRV